MNKYVVIPVEELLKDVNKCLAGFKIHDKVPTNLSYICDPGQKNNHE